MLADYTIFILRDSYIIMKEKMTLFFKGMKPFEISLFIVLGLTAVVLPFSWVLSTWMLGLLVVNSCVLAVVSRRFGNPSLQKWARWSLWLLVAFYLLQEVSLIYTANMKEAGTMLMHRLPLLIFPLCCLMCNTAFLTRDRQRMLVWLLTGSLVVKFFIRLIYMLCTYHKIVFSSTFDPVHHSYMAMYLLFVLLSIDF